MGACDEAFGVSLGETAPSADLGGSSKYSNENFEGRSGEGFHVNSSSDCPLILLRPPVGLRVSWVPDPTSFRFKQASLASAC